MKKSIKKLSLNKMTITNLDSKEMSLKQGGIRKTMIGSVCGLCSMNSSCPPSCYIC